MAEVRPPQKLGWRASKAQWMENHPKTRKAVKTATVLGGLVAGAAVERAGFAAPGQFFNVVLLLPFIAYSLASAGLSWLVMQGVASPFRVALNKEQNQTIATVQKEKAGVEAELKTVQQRLAAMPDVESALARFSELREGLSALVEKQLTPHVKTQEDSLRKALRAIQSIISELERPLQAKKLAEIGEVTAEKLEKELQGKILPLFLELKKHLDAARPAIHAGLGGLEDLKFLLGLMGFEPISPEDYEKVVQIGQGGMGAVYKAIRTDGQAVAIKTCSLTNNAEALSRFFKREAPAVQRINHPNVVACHAYGWTTKDIKLADDSVLPAGTAVMIMDIVSGGDLSGHIKAKVQLSIDEAVIFGLQMLDGVSAAHEQGIIHRDIKPANILLNEERTQVEVTDFGIARVEEATAMTRAGAALGTPTYMAPEQARGLEASEKSDLYAIAEIIFEMVAGQALWKHPDFREIDDVLVAKGRRSGDYLEFIEGRIDYFIRPKSDQLADRLIEALRQEPEDRPTMEEFKKMLEEIDISEPTSLGEQEMQLTAEAPPSAGQLAVSSSKPSGTEEVSALPFEADSQGPGELPGPKTRVSPPLELDGTLDSGADPTTPEALPAQVIVSPKVALGPHAAPKQPAAQEPEGERPKTRMGVGNRDKGMVDMRKHPGQGGKKS